MRSVDETARRAAASVLAAAPPPPRPRRHSRASRAIAVVAVAAVAVAGINRVTSESPTTQVRAGDSKAGDTGMAVSATATKGALSVRLELPTRTIRTGTTLDGVAILANQSGSPITVSGCSGIYQLGLRSDSLQLSYGITMCLRKFTIPVGESRYTLSLVADFPACSPGNSQLEMPPCGEGGKPPPLPPGIYSAYAKAIAGPGLPDAAGISITITP